MPGTHTSHAAAEALSAVASLAGLDAATTEAVAQAAMRRDYAAGEVVFLEGEPCEGLYVVQNGWLKSVKTSASGREQVIRFVGPGEVFNEIGTLTGESNLVTVVALEPAVVWIICRDRLLQLMDEHPRLVRIITQNLAKRVQHLISLVEDLSLRTVEARLARFLLEQSPTGDLPRRRWSTQVEMAAQLGTVPEVLNRALKSLAEEGLIRMERHRIRVLNREGLEIKAMLRE